MTRLGVDAVKIHASDINNLPFLEHVGQREIPVLLAVGGATDQEIARAIELLSCCRKPLILMHGYQDGPTAVGDTHFAKIGALKDLYDLPVGYSDHVAGSVGEGVDKPNSLALTFPFFAIGAGACVIEKHVMLDRTKAWEDFESALTVTEMRDFVFLIRETERSMGSKSAEPNLAEVAYRRAIKTVISKRNIDVGDILTQDDLDYKRVNEADGNLKDPSLIIGRRASTSISKDQAITLRMLS